MVKIALIAHNVSTPLYTHRSKEFSDRMYFMSKQYEEIHIISKEGRMGFKNKTPIHDEIASNILIHKIRSGLVSSSLDILRIVNDVGADVIFADSLNHGGSSLFSHKKYGIPLITFLQGFEADLLAISFKLRFGLKPIPGLLSEILSPYDAAVLRSSDRILCVSSGLVDYAKKLTSQKDWSKIVLSHQSFEYVRLTDDAKKWVENYIHSLEISKNQNILLIAIIGTGSEKGTETALIAFKQIIKEQPNAILLLISKEISSIYVRMVHTLGLKENVLFFQNLQRDKVLALLSHSALLLCPSLSEGFSRAVSEAMVLGVPVVAFANKSLADVLNYAVIGVKTTIPADYASACLSLIKDKDLSNKICQNAYSYIKPFASLSEEQRLRLICKNIDEILTYESKI